MVTIPHHPEPPHAAVHRDELRVALSAVVEELRTADNCLRAHEARLREETERRARCSADLSDTREMLRRTRQAHAALGSATSSSVHRAEAAVQRMRSAVHHVHRAVEEGTRSMVSFCEESLAQLAPLSSRVSHDTRAGTARLHELSDALSASRATQSAALAAAEDRLAELTQRLNTAEAAEAEAKAEMKRLRGEQSKRHADQKRRQVELTAATHRLREEASDKAKEAAESALLLKKQRAAMKASADREAQLVQDLAALQERWNSWQATEKALREEVAVEKARAAQAQSRARDLEGAFSDSKSVGFGEYVRLRRELGNIAVAGREFFADPNSAKSQNHFLRSLARAETILDDSVHAVSTPGSARSKATAPLLPAGLVSLQTIDARGPRSRSASLAMLPFVAEHGFGPA